MDIELVTDPYACMMYIVSPLAIDIRPNKDWTCKDKDKDKDFTRTRSRTRTRIRLARTRTRIRTRI